MDKIESKSEVSNIQENCPSLEDMPNEILVNIISYLDRVVDIKDILRTAHVSKRIRDICFNTLCWEKMNLFWKKVPSEFLQIVIESGCKYLSLYRTEITGNLNSIKPSVLKYLDLSYCDTDQEVIEQILSSCHFLEKLSLHNIVLNSKIVDSICMNGQTLLVISFFLHRLPLYFSCIFHDPHLSVKVDAICNFLKLNLD